MIRSRVFFFRQSLSEFGKIYSGLNLILYPTCCRKLGLVFCLVFLFFVFCFLLFGVFRFFVFCFLLFGVFCFFVFCFSLFGVFCFFVFCFLLFGVLCFLFFAFWGFLFFRFLFFYLTTVGGTKLGYGMAWLNIRTSVIRQTVYCLIAST
jgi:hypothetical protein